MQVLTTYYQLEQVHRSPNGQALFSTLVTFSVWICVFASCNLLHVSYKLFGVTLPSPPLPSPPLPSPPLSDYHQATTAAASNPRLAAEASWSAGCTYNGERSGLLSAAERVHGFSSCEAEELCGGGFAAVVPWQQ